VVASPDHCDAFKRELDHPGIDRAGLADGQLTFLDAQETLDSFMIDRRPDRVLFQRTIGTLVRQIRQHTGSSGLRANGEMVGILWTAGQYSAAIQLEEFWNELLESERFSLFCGYPIDVFGREFQADSIYAILCDHTHVVPTGANDNMDRAVSQAMDEILGSEGQDLRIGLKHASAWAAIPTAEARILWLRNHIPDSADDVLTRARQLYQTASHQA
jgi:hypothetical protein